VAEPDDRVPRKGLAEQKSFRLNYHVPNGLNRVGTFAGVNSSFAFGPLEEMAMVFVAVVCGISGLLLGLIANVRALAFLTLFTAPAAFLSATGSGEGYLISAMWAVLGLVILQVGYVVAIVIRATLFAETHEVRQPVSTP
jgi:hypothetical protein